jgi:hypothetical protein
MYPRRRYDRGVSSRLDVRLLDDLLDHLTGKVLLRLLFCLARLFTSTRAACQADPWPDTNAQRDNADT